MEEICFFLNLTLSLLPQYNLVTAQAAAVSNEKLAGPIDGVGQCFSEKKVAILIVVF